MKHLNSTCSLEKERNNSAPKRQDTLRCKIISSPVGNITLLASDTALLSLNWGISLTKLQTILGDSNSIIENTECQLNEYFAGQRRIFDIPINPEGTEFQKRVWQQLLKIPYGQTISYGEQARRLGQPKAMRAVGAANGRNPVGIIIPCHRVIGASGGLTGFAGGIEIKKKLLNMEGLDL